ncbi:hypothetical protein KQI49_13350 [Virgibacillus sp. MSJ-26]|uniref:hypothetical protein n=1 Tax=Virgibacillus sp. MSJ-26 TaxID=2841522 RepID=UPI001C11055E|nr:hypothetical protein [Virgibacillus sp. MSJ-26]MBU5467809.1 hypothetical protein [Virgibacillus sp. MSJ-26]
MKEQEQYKTLLKKVIEATENNKINTSEELIQTLVYELKNNSKQVGKAPSQSFAQ